MKERKNKRIDEKKLKKYIIIEITKDLCFTEKIIVKIFLRLFIRIYKEGINFGFNNK